MTHNPETLALCADAVVLDDYGVALVAWMIEMILLGFGGEA